MISYTFSGLLWQHSAPGGWHFVSIPPDMASEIRMLLQNDEQGWGRLPVTAYLMTQEWKTAIWYDTKFKTYLLPIKSAIRMKANLQVGATVEIRIRL